MLSPIGFWSYSNTDDDHSRGRLSQLRALLASELQQKIGRKLKVNIFQDVAAIPPGAEWEKQIRDAINGSFFLIPIVTPALLQSEWCCQEITLFRQREATTLRRSDLIFPLHYLNVDDRDPSRTEDCHDEEVFRFLRSRQWTDFRALRHKNPESEDVARKIDTLADAICSALRRAEQDHLNVEEESRRKVTAQMQDRARPDNDRREDETEVKAETVQKRLEAEAKRAEEEAKKSAADRLANETAIEERRRREAKTEQKRGQAAQQQAENQSPTSEPKGRLGEGEHRAQSSDWWPTWFRSWSYFKIAVPTGTSDLEGGIQGKLIEESKPGFIQSNPAFTRWSFVVVLLGALIATAVTIRSRGTSNESFDSGLRPAPSLQTGPIAGTSSFEIRTGVEARGSQSGAASYVGSIGECEQKCAQSKECNLFTYGRRLRACFVYSHADLVSNESFDSGLRK